MPSRPRSGGRGPGPAEGRITKDGGRGRGPGRTGPRGGGCLRSRRAAPGCGPGPARSRRDRRPPPGAGRGGRPLGGSMAGRRTLRATRREDDPSSQQEWRDRRRTCLPKRGSHRGSTRRERANPPKGGGAKPRVYRAAGATEGRRGSPLRRGRGAGYGPGGAVRWPRRPGCRTGGASRTARPTVGRFSGPRARSRCLATVAAGGGIGWALVPRQPPGVFIWCP